MVPTHVLVEIASTVTIDPPTWGTRRWIGTVGIHMRSKDSGDKSKILKYNTRSDPEKYPRAQDAMGDEEGNRIEIRHPGRFERGRGVSFV